MNITLEEFEQYIHPRLRLNQRLLTLSVIISCALFLFNTGYVLWSMYFLAIGSLSLFTINNCKTDRKHFRSGQLPAVNGKLVDLFPEDEKEKNWIVFIQEADGKVKEFTIPFKPELELEKEYHGLYTPKLKMLVKLGA